MNWERATSRHRAACPGDPPQRAGFPPEVGEAGGLVAISGEKGAIFLLTMDGLILQTLGGDM